MIVKLDKVTPFLPVIITLLHIMIMHKLFTIPPNQIILNWTLSITTIILYLDALVVGKLSKDYSHSPSHIIKMYSYHEKFLIYLWKTKHSIYRHNLCAWVVVVSAPTPKLKTKSVTIATNVNLKPKIYYQLFCLINYQLQD